jgi:hypothetical protein
MNEDLESKTMFELVCILNKIQIEENKIGIRTIELEKERLQVIKEMVSRLPKLKNDENINPKSRRLKNE